MLWRSDASRQAASRNVRGRPVALVGRVVTLGLDEARAPSGELGLEDLAQDVADEDVALLNPRGDARGDADAVVDVLLQRTSIVSGEGHGDEALAPRGLEPAGHVRRAPARRPGSPRADAARGRRG